MSVPGSVLELLRPAHLLQSGMTPDLSPISLPRDSLAKPTNRGSRHCGGVEWPCQSE